MIKLLLIGHRGVGKTTLLNNIKKNFVDNNVLLLSLDDLIEETIGSSIAEIFEKQGEQEFRVIENRCLANLATLTYNNSVVIDVGAGFFGGKPPDFGALWVKRKIDSSQSLFLDRPGLDGDLMMSEQRFLERERHYKEIADLEIELREGISVFNFGEKQFFKTLLFDGRRNEFLQDWSVTLREESTMLETKLLTGLGIKQFELRDDLLSERRISDFSRSLPCLRSFRKDKDISKVSEDLWDWPLEWGENTLAPILSVHEKSDDFASTIKTFPKGSQVLKLAISVDNFQELKQGHSWFLEDPEHRCFLPHSKQGRWSWYRLLMAQKMPLQFLRLGEGSAQDQPSLLEVLNFNKDFKNFAAILGSPVAHSFTPTFHQDYFSTKKANVLNIDIAEDEFEEALPFLQSLGLKWAAVTSPLKKVAGDWTQSSTPVNTLYFDGTCWHSTSTDHCGFAKLASGDLGEVAIWGGGGTHSAIEAQVPEATFYSSRTGAIKKGKFLEAPQTLIWAVGSESFSKEGLFPPREWPLKSILDLNYTQDSPGIQCAHEFSCQYLSGLGMFVAQAEKQQEFWNECELK